MGAIRISCAGDLLPADTAYNIGNGIGSSMERLISYYSVNENNPFLNSDIVFCNLEAPLSMNQENIKKPFEGNPAVLQLMKILNITVVSIANNHMLDHGEVPFEITRAELEENRFNHIGSIDGKISKIVFSECQGKKFAFAAFNAVNDHPGSRLIAPLDREILFNTLHEINLHHPDLILFSIHWGNEYVAWPSPVQADLAHELIDNGVNIIIGHHPHVVQPVEKYNGGIIFYSLGNFMFDMFWAKKVRQGILADLIIKDDGSLDYNIKPFRIRHDFTQDFSENNSVLNDLSKADRIFKNLKAGQNLKYEIKYLRECKKQRLAGRIDMKLYLLKNLFRLSPQSWNFLWSNIKLKSDWLWKKN
jgi:gamma-polyglutamate biosynthesis protein CapA